MSGPADSTPNPCPLCGRPINACDLTGPEHNGQAFSSNFTTPLENGIKFLRTVIANSPHDEDERMLADQMLTELLQARTRLLHALAGVVELLDRDVRHYTITARNMASDAIADAQHLWNGVTPI